VARVKVKTKLRNRPAAVDPGNDFMLQLPVFKMARTGNMLRVTCPRKGCGGVFSVKPKKWRESSELPTRPCPYCFKVSKITNNPKEV
jgi:hypothetical protein